MTVHRATSAVINLDAFRHNLRTIKSIIGPNVATMAIIKADAYGHGAIPCAHSALKEGVKYFGVGIIQEGIELRESGVSVPILILGGVHLNEVEDLIKYNLSTSLYNLTVADAISKQAKQYHKKIGVHIKIDSGMGRLGVKPQKFKDLLNIVINNKNLKLEGIFTHLACADEKETNKTQNQISCFSKILHKEYSGNLTDITVDDNPISIHSANTSGLIRFPESRFNMVRPGISLYGSLPSFFLNQVFNELVNKKVANKLQPVMHWKTKIIQVQSLPKGSPLSYGGLHVTKQNSLIATIPVGYADGLNRSLSGNMEVLVKEKRVKQVGAICMDMCLIDVTNIPGELIGQEVIIFGNQGKSKIFVEELATKAQTIPYEILCGIGKRVPRIYTS